MKKNEEKNPKKFTPKRFNETIKTRKVDYDLREGDVKEEFSSDRKQLRIVSEVFGEFREPEEKLPIDIDGGGKTGGGTKPGNGDEPEWKKYADSIKTDLREEMATNSQTLREEFAEGNQKLKEELREEFNAGNQKLKEELREEFAEGNKKLKEELREEFAEGNKKLK
ncbi:hypothetical protein, partial [Mycoplasmopsis agassizii]